MPAANDGTGVDLKAIAELLEDRALSDWSTHNRDGWQERIGPITRPFLEAVAKSVGLGKVKYYSAGDVEEARECFDNVHWGARQKLRLTVRLGPWYVSDEVAENLLVWGVFAWVTKSRDRDLFIYRLREVDQKVPGFRLAEAPVHGVQSGYVGLIKSLDAPALRQQTAAELIPAIKRDLEAISLRF